MIDCIHRKEKIGRFPEAAGMGDYMQSAFITLGLTEERAEVIATEFLGMKGCGCNRRSRFFNFIGEKMGLPPGRGPELNKHFQELRDNRQDMFRCDLHKKCILRSKMSPEVVQIVEDQGIKACTNCNDLISGNQD